MALPADATSHRVFSLDPGDYVVRLIVTNAGSESSFSLTVSAIVSSGDSSSDNSGLVAGLVICILVILPMSAVLGVIFFKWYR